MPENVKYIKADIERELFDSVLPFWQAHSIDHSNGGYYNCLDEKGQVYDTTKYMWLHGRQVWMFSKLYNILGKQKEWLDVAAHGLNFMKMHAVQENGRVYFSLNEKGEAVYLQRKLFTECFYAMALAEYGKAIQAEDLLADARLTLEQIWDYSLDPQKLGRPSFPGELPMQTLAIPMIILNVIEEVYGEDYLPVADKVEHCIEQIKKHFVDGVVYENVLPGGETVSSVKGRLLNPGHAIEAGWFLFHWAGILKDQSLKDLAASFICNSFDLGWDKEYDGLFYFLDARGKPPTQLEWNMKLWWPHTESLYAFLLLYSDTKDPQYLSKFKTVKDYVFRYFADVKNGEWYGYLNRDNTISSTLKGGPYKGCFHVPRALLYCLNILQTLT